MPNIKSQIKRVATSQAANERNKAMKSKAKTLEKKVLGLVAEGKKEEAVAAFREAVSYLDSLARQNVLSANSANRRKASLQKAVAAL
ncbi:MAG: 30S ribosomal protein S20 [Bacilli bacterium]|nr:30S ribosomal protein S20 [Bacilli bacterium]